MSVLYDWRVKVWNAIKEAKAGFLYSLSFEAVSLEPGSCLFKYFFPPSLPTYHEAERQQASVSLPFLLPPIPHPRAGVEGHAQNHAHVAICLLR